LNPVLQSQASNPGKFAAVAGNQGALLAERMGRNRGVQRAASSKGRMMREAKNIFSASRLRLEPLLATP